MLLLKKYIIPRYHFKFHMTQFNPSTNIVNQQLRSYIEVRTHAWTWERNFRVMQIFFHFIYYSWCYYFCGIIDVLNSVFGVMEVAYQHCLDWYSSCKLMLARCFPSVVFMRPLLVVYKSCCQILTLRPPSFLSIGRVFIICFLSSSFLVCIFFKMYLHPVAISCLSLFIFSNSMWLPITWW